MAVPLGENDALNPTHSPEVHIRIVMYRILHNAAFAAVEMLRQLQCCVCDHHSRGLLSTACRGYNSNTGTSMRHWTSFLARYRATPVKGMLVGASCTAGAVTCRSLARFLPLNALVGDLLPTLAHTEHALLKLIALCLS